MKTQAWAWLTAGVVALGLNGFYNDGGAAWAHRMADRIADRVDYAVERVSGHAEQVLAKAQMASDREEMNLEQTAREETPSCPLSTALVRVQNRLARTQVRRADFDAMSAREQAQMDRWQGEQERVQARVQAQVQAQVDRQMARAQIRMARVVDPVEIHVACPRVRVNVPAVRIPAVNIPEVRIPRVTIPQIPAVRITVPVVAGDDSDSGPI